MSDRRFDIMAVGSPIMDSLAKVGEEFITSISGEKGGMELIDGEAMQMLASQVDADMVHAPGGSAANTIFGATRLGLSSTFLGKVGNDDIADQYTTTYADMGGDTSRFKVAETPNGRCISLITPDSQRTMRTHLGAAMELAPNEITVEDFKDAAHVHLEGYTLFNRDLMLHVLNCAKKAGCRISLDLASFEVVNAGKDILDTILRDYVDVVFANEDEADAFTAFGNDYEAMARHLGELCEIAVVKLGADGALVCHNGEVIKIDAEHAADVVDITGAGDLFAAGFLYGLLKGHSHENSARCGAILGAEVVQVIGAAIPTSRWNDIKNKIDSVNGE